MFDDKEFWKKMESFEKDRPCGHECLTGYDIGLPSNSVAYPHPDCPIHGHLWMPFDNQWSRDYVAAHPERFKDADKEFRATKDGD